MYRNVKLPPVQYDIIALEGGLDLITPTLSLKPGVAREALNFEVSVTGGYTRIKGYERFDGQLQPSAAVVGRIGFLEAAPVAPGDTITGVTSGTTAQVIDFRDSTISYTKATGTFTESETLEVLGVPVGTVDQASFVAASVEVTAILQNLAADVYRADIAEVPGSGPVRGVAFFQGALVAWRNNVGGTALGVYQSSSAGWVQLTFDRELRFSSGLVAGIADGDAIVGATSGATATVLRVAVRTGDFGTNDAEGLLVIGSVTGAFTPGETINVGGTPRATADAADAAITLQPNGLVRTYEASFGGAVQSLYIVDGVNRAHEWDGTVLTPIETGTPDDSPDQVIVHKQHLFLAFGASVQFSGIGEPYRWSPIFGAGEIQALAPVTGFLSMQGNQDGGALMIASLRSIEILYGTDSENWQLNTYNDNMGAADETLRRLEQAYSLDERGVVQLAQGQNFGNFDAATLTFNVRPFIRERRTRAIGAVLNREKSQYRVLYSDNSALYCTLVNGQFRGSMPIEFAHAPSCLCQGENANGAETSFFGSDNGFVYLLDAGTSFDGEPIPYSLLLNYNAVQSPRLLKRFRRCSLEVTGNGYSAFSFTYELGYSNSRQEQAATKSYAAPFSQAFWDSFTWDAFTWDGRTLAPTEVEMRGTGENVALRIAGNSDFVEEFTINTAILHFTTRRGLR